MRDEEGELLPSSWTAHGSGSPEAGVCVAQRERSASAARAQRELSAPAHEYANTQKPVARAAELGAAVAAAAQLAGRRHTHGPSPSRPRRHAACGKFASRQPANQPRHRGARDGEARRRRPSACGRPPARHARMARHKGGRSTTTPLPCMRACTCVRSTQPQEARLERPSSPPRSRPASSDQAHRASSVGSHLEGRLRLIKLDCVLRKGTQSNW